MYLNSKECKWILLVDDEEDIRTSLKEVIQLQYGNEIKVIEAKDGLEATTKINYQKFDCIITDLSMPRKEGEAFIHSVRSNPLNDSTPVIVISGSTGLEKIKKEFEFVDTIPKPYRVDKVIATLGSCLKVGNNKKRVSANVLNNIINSVEKFVKDLEKGNVSQKGSLEVKKKGVVVDHDYVSSIQFKIGSVVNTFSIMAREGDISTLFSSQEKNPKHSKEHLMQSMSFVILKNVLERSSLQSNSTLKGSYIQKDKSLLTDKKGLIIGLGNDDIQIDIFATSE